MFWRAVRGNRTWLIRACHQPSSSPAPPGEKLRWKVSELPTAHRSHSLGLPDKHFRKSFQKYNLDIHYLSQPSRAHSPAFPGCFQRGVVAQVAALQSPDMGLGRDKTMEQGEGAACGCSRVGFEAGAQYQSGSPLFFCSELCLSALWRSELSFGSSEQTGWFYLFVQKINPSTKQRIIPGSAPCSSWCAHGQAGPWGLNPSPCAQLWVTGPFIQASQHLPKSCSEIRPQ